MLGHKVRLVRDWDVFNMKRREGQAGSIRFTGRLAKLTQLIDKVVDGLDKLKAEEGIWSCWFVGEGDAQMIHGRCTTKEDHLWGNINALMDDGRWLVALKGKSQQLNPNSRKLDHDCKLWAFDNKPLCELEWIQWRYGNKNQEQPN